MAPDQSTQTIEVAEDWLLIQSAVGEALRVSMAEITDEPLPGCLRLLLLRLAFAELTRDLALQEANAAIRDEVAC